MRADLKNLHSPDILDLKNYVPNEEDNFGFLLQMIVGRKSYPNDGESFDIFICTPKWLQENKKQQKLVIGLHYIILFEYSYELLYTRLKQLVESMDGKSWQHICYQLSKIGKWEFEGYLD